MNKLEAIIKTQAQNYAKTKDISRTKFSFVFAKLKGEYKRPDMFEMQISRTADSCNLKDGIHHIGSKHTNKCTVNSSKT